MLQVHAQEDCESAYACILYPLYAHAYSKTVQLVLASLERGSRQHIDTLDILFDLSSPIYAFCRPENLDAHHKVLELRQELLLKWRQGNGATRRLMNADSWALKPWRSVDSAPPCTEEHQQLCDTRQTQVFPFSCTVLVDAAGIVSWKLVVAGLGTALEWQSQLIEPHFPCAL